MSAVSRRAVNVINLGRMGFMAAYDVQMRYARQHLDEMDGKPYTYGEDTLLLVEHTPVYTVGIRHKDYTEEDVTRLKATGAEFLRTNRGGLITFHGPGQLVVYPILNLQHFKPSMRWYVSKLEETILATLQRFGMTGRTTDQTGIWVEDRKVASIGLHGSRYVTTHGISVNCNLDLSWFEPIVPCGLQGVEMTSLSRELEHNVPVQDTIKPFLRSFRTVFDCDLEFKMMEEGELKSITTLHNPNSPSDEPSQAKDSSGVRVASNKAEIPTKAESSVRHMSTVASHVGDRSKDLQLKTHDYLAKVRPMW